MALPLYLNCSTSQAAWDKLLSEHFSDTLYQLIDSTLTISAHASHKTFLIVLTLPVTKSIHCNHMSAYLLTPFYLIF